MALPEATAKVNETNLNLVTAAWPEDTRWRFVIRRKCPAGAYRASKQE